MICAHCGLHIEVAETLPNGCRYRHSTTGWRSCFFDSVCFAEPDVAPTADPSTGEVPF